jgi:hypothetical protein
MTDDELDTMLDAGDFPTDLEQRPGETALEKDLDRKRKLVADEVAREKLRKLVAERDGIPLDQVVL